MLLKTLIALLLSSAISPAVLAGEPCPLPARECEAQIRQMLGGRRYLGVRFEKTRYGIMIRSVVEGSPAEAAGFLRDDLIVSVNGRNVTRIEIKELKELFRQKAGRDGTLTFVVTRYGQIRRLHAKLGAMPKAAIDKIVEAHLRDAHGGATSQGQK
ncbi:MAG TPA: PDZ domain-containing protein [Thermoanaerobaculia bacterium]|nr:PDZ domain-containing protein [Thermoanaerobaculia bacterium]